MRLETIDVYPEAGGACVPFSSFLQNTQSKRVHGITFRVGHKVVEWRADKGFQSIAGPNNDWLPLNSEARLKCLEWALAKSQPGQSPESVVAAAQAYYEFAYG